MKHIRFVPVFALVGLLAACAGPKYYDNMGRAEFTKQCASDVQRRNAGVSQEVARNVCSCSYSGAMRAYGNSVAAMERAYRTNRAAYNRTLNRIAQTCSSRAFKRG